MRRPTLFTRLFAVLAIAVLTMAATPILVPEVSQDRISIRGDFNGAQLLLFGAITYPPGTRNTDQADIVVVLKGPVESIVVREKQQIAGIWINAASSEFRSAPGISMNWDCTICSFRRPGRLTAANWIVSSMDLWT